MYGKRTFFIIGLFILANIAVIGPTSAQVPNSVYIEPASVWANIGDSFTIDIMAFEVVGVNSYEICLFYDTTVLDCAPGDPVIGTFIPPPYRPFVTVDELGGKVTIGVLNLDPLQEVSGSGVLCTLGFTVTGAGSSVLDIGLWNSGPGESHNWLLDIGGLPIDHVSENGGVNLHPRDVVVTALTAPASVNVGDLVPINVTVDNFGCFNEIVNVTVTAEPGAIPIGSDLDINLDAWATKTLSYSWNTTGVMAGTYTINATASVYVDDNPANNVMTATIEVKEVTMYLARLVGRSAWPEHHHWTAKDEDENNTLYAKVRAIGMAPTEVRVQFTVDSPSAYDPVLNTTSIVLDPAVNRGIGYVDVPFKPEYLGKHYVTAICQYKDSSNEWTDSTIKTKTFSFAVASLK